MYSGLARSPRGRILRSENVPRRGTLFLFVQERSFEAHSLSDKKNGIRNENDRLKRTVVARSQ